MFTDDITLPAQAVLARAQELKTKIALAESCTGGMLAGALTSQAGASAVFDRGWVTYSNTAKTELLGVPSDMIKEHGSVSLEVAGAMASSALARSHADLAVGVTGIAGPGGGSDDKPVGTVWFGLAKTNGQRRTHCETFADMDRDGVRLAAVRWALQWMLNAMREQS